MIVGFDLEITGPLPEGVHWKEVQDLAVSCAALSDAVKKSGMLWYSAPGNNAITHDACRGMLNMLHRLSRDHQIIIWNGLGFDLPFLARMTGEWEKAAETIMRCYDPCYAALKLFGWPIGLDKTCIGFGVPGKPEDMDGLKAVSMWAKPLQRPKVLEYVIQDAAAAAMLGKLIAQSGEIRWQARSLALNSKPMPWLPVEEFYKLPMPDQSWMTDPLTEKHFTWWLP